MKRIRSSGDEVTLFPFLAVLICTMGCLVVLLVVVVMQAKASAADTSRQRQDQATRAAAEMTQVAEEIQDLQWQIEILQGSRAKTVEDLENRRAELSYLEDEIRQLRGRLERAAAEAVEIQELAESKTQADVDAERRLQTLREQLDYAREALAQTRQDYEHRPPSYALVPFRGANGTRRRPIYIECEADRIVLQPEGVELSADDFREPLTDDNPLAAALRAQREHLKDAAGTDAGLPYPLIVVRPDGAQSYAAARAAMQSWDTEFGYELVDADMKLAYPPSDSAMVQIVRDAVEEARARRQLLQSIAPARFGRRNAALMTASKTGGFVSQGGGEGQLRRGGVGPSATGPAFGSRGRSGRGRTGNAGVDTGEDEGDENGVDRSTGGRGSSGVALVGARKQREAETVSDADPAGTVTDPSGAEPLAAAAGERGSGRAGGQGPASSEGFRGRQRPERASDGGKAGPRGEERTASSEPDAGARDGTAQDQVATGRTRQPPRDASAGGGNAAVGGASSHAAGSNGSSASGGAGASAGMPPWGGESLAATRGEDWGLPDRAAAATGITRPISIACYPDRLVLRPEDRRQGEPIMVTVEGSLQDEVDELVTLIWQRMETWGTAGVRMYWKPVLRVQVEAGANDRYAELAGLLEDSGIVVSRK